MFWNKKGMEIAISTVVGLILGALMLVAGIALLVSIMGSVDGTHSKISEEMEREILKAFDSNSPVYVHNNRISSKGNEDVVFGIGIYNIFNNTRDFRIDIVSGMGNLSSFEADNDLKVAFLADNLSIAPRDKAVTFVIAPTKNLQGRGQYSLVLNVSQYNGSAWVGYDKPKLLYVIR
ncbi:MAG: hypothetical protein ACLFN8_02900 [Candidatus Woesearchaeota archaeon]